MGSCFFNVSANVLSVDQLLGQYEAVVFDDYFREIKTTPVFSAGEEENEIIISNLFPTETLGETNFSVFLDVEKQVLVLPNFQNLNIAGSYQLWVTEWEGMDFSYPDSYECEIEENGDIAMQDYWTSYSIWSKEDTEVVGRDQFIVAYWDTVCKPTGGSGEDSGINGNLQEENSPVYYFDLSGRKLTTPAKGRIIIKKQGTDTSKIISK